MLRGGGKEASVGAELWRSAGTPQEMLRSEPRGCGDTLASRNEARARSWAKLLGEWENSTALV